MVAGTVASDVADFGPECTFVVTGPDGHFAAAAPTLRAPFGGAHDSPGAVGFDPDRARVVVVRRVGDASYMPAPFLWCSTSQVRGSPCGPGRWSDEVTTSMTGLPA